MLELALVLLFGVALVAFANWRGAFAICVVMALLQDPLRKMVPGQPVYFIVFVGVAFLAAFLGAHVARVPLAPGKIAGWRENLGQPFLWFLVLAALQCVNSLVRFGNPVMTLIGLASYLAPIPAVVLAYRFALSRGELGMTRWMRFYVGLALVALTTVYLEWAGMGLRIFGEVGEGVLISGAGAYYRGNSGIFRAAEIAAWHSATVACFLVMLFWGKRFSPAKILVALLIVVFLLGLGALTGRRKMIIEVAIFLSAFVCMVGWYQRGNLRFAIVAAVLGVASYAVAVGSLAPDAESGYASERVTKTNTNEFGKYTERASTVFEDLPRRLVDTGTQPVVWAVQGFGIFGGGLGVGSQGAQHFGAPPSGAAEGGLGKLTVELGVPGLFVVAWVLYRLVRWVRRILNSLSRTSPRHANFAYGLVAFLLANLAAFSVATQAYADMFILLTLGWSFGFLLALPVLAARQVPGAAAPGQARPLSSRAGQFPLQPVPDLAHLEYTRRTWDGATPGEGARTDSG